MIRSKFTVPVCAAVVALALVFTIIFAYTDVLGIQASQAALGYEARLFDGSRVHTIDIVADGDDWEAMLESALDKEYIPCTVVIDGEKLGNAAIRPKGNTSLSSVQGMDSRRYSFKVEFDHYAAGSTYHGLDKLSLNNLIYDATYMKDYLVYDMMRFIGADAPLASFAIITVNGEDWGLYLAVEAVEDAFLQRNYGSGHGNLYKPDSMQLKNDMQDLRAEFEGRGGQRTPDAATATPGNAGGFAPGEGGAQPSGGFQPPEGFTPGSGGRGGGPGGRGGNDVALQYTDDDPESYANIFGSAKTPITEADKTRLIASLKQLSEGADLEEVVDVEEVLRYFVAHNFAVSFDSYTGSMMHNYYLYEEEGRLSMIAWDYNLAFGTFSGMGGGGDGAAEAVNYPIDTPVSGATLEDRPLLGQLLSDETYLARYHELFSEFISGYFESGHFDELLARMAALLAPYVGSDPSAFYTLEEFEAGVEALRTFCALRAQSVRGQLDGSIPATAEGQAADASDLVDASGLNLRDMGAMGGSRGRDGGENGARTTNR